MRAGAKCECEGLGNFSYLPMWVHSWGCWFRVGGVACIRGSVLEATATKVVGLGSGLGSLWGFFVLCACVVLLVMSVCVVLIGVVLLVLFACVVLFVMFDCVVYLVFCLCYSARVLLLYFACPK